MTNDCIPCRYSTNMCRDHQRMVEGGQLADDLALVKRIEDHDNAVTRWESNLMESCFTRLGTGTILTDPQRVKCIEALDRLDGMNLPDFED